MIIVMKPNANQSSIRMVTDFIAKKGLETHLSKGHEVTIIGVIGDKTTLNRCSISALPEVDKIVDITETYKLANKKFHPEPSRIKVGNTVIGGKEITVIAGPCSIESRDCLMETAIAVKKAGAQILRGGAFKPRTSPYAFQGLEEEGLKYMKEASRQTGLATVCEVTSLDAIEKAVKYVDMLQIGARNMQNFFLLKEAGKTGLPILLKRGLSATIDEWLNAAEYIMAEGNPKSYSANGASAPTRRRPEIPWISALSLIRSKSPSPSNHRPKPRHRRPQYVSPLAKGAVVTGCDGLMIEVHPNPSVALSDGPQSLTLDQFDQLCSELKPLIRFIGRSFNEK